MLVMGYFSLILTSTLLGFPRLSVTRNPPRRGQERTIVCGDD